MFFPCLKVCTFVFTKKVGKLTTFFLFCFFLVCIWGNTFQEDCCRILFTFFCFCFLFSFLLFFQDREISLLKKSAVSFFILWPKQPRKILNNLQQSDCFFFYIFCCERAYNVFFLFFFHLEVLFFSFSKTKTCLFHLKGQSLFFAHFLLWTKKKQRLPLKSKQHCSYD